MSRHILQINLHKSNVALVKLNKYVKNAYDNDYVRRKANVDDGGPGTGVDVDTGPGGCTYGSTIDKYKNIEKIIEIDRLTDLVAPSVVLVAPSMVLLE